MKEKIVRNKFLFKQLVQRDFKKRYKGTILGVAWSVLYPLIDLAILLLVFTKLLGRNIEHYPIYVFSGTILMAYFREATREGMKSLLYNRHIIDSINVPKHLFVLSKNVASLFNFVLTLIVFVIISIIDGVSLSAKLLLLVFPIVCITIFNIGIGLILSASYVFFRDMAYLYDLLLVIINYLSATFYRIDSFSKLAQKLFLLNPLYVYISYFREIVLCNSIPSLLIHVLCLVYAVITLFIGLAIYKKNKNKFIYYL